MAPPGFFPECGTAYAEWLLRRPTAVRERLRHAELAYFSPSVGAPAVTTFSEGAGFPQWECVIPVSAVPSVASDLFEGGEDFPSLRAVGRLRRPRERGELDTEAIETEDQTLLRYLQNVAAACSNELHALRELRQAMLSRELANLRQGQLKEETAEEEQDYDVVVELSFRGSVNASNWATNFTADLEPAQVGDCRGLAHRGFQQAYVALRASLRSEIDRGLADVGADPGRTLVLVTGHSLGGALATFAAYDLACSAGLKVNLVTWATPPIGDAELAGAIFAAVPCMARFVNKLDPVPHLLVEESMTLDAGATSGVAAQIRALGVVGSSHPCPATVLDPEASNQAHWIVFGIEAAALAIKNQGNMIRTVKQFFAPHDVVRYALNLEEAMQRQTGCSLLSSAPEARRWQRLPSVGTWLLPRSETSAADGGKVVRRLSWSLLPNEVEGLFRRGRTFLAELEASGPAVLLDYSKTAGTQAQELLRTLGVDVSTDGRARLVEVLGTAPKLLETEEGTRLLREAQERLVNELPVLLALAQESGGLTPEALVLKKELTRSCAGRDLVAWGKEHWKALKHDPEMLKTWLTSIDLSSFSGDGASSGFSTPCQAVISAAMSRCMGIFQKPATRKLLQKIGVEIDTDGNVNLADVLGNSKQLLETPEGTEILRFSQQHVLKLIPTLTAKASGLGLSDSSLAYLRKVEETQQGRALLNWGRGSLQKAQQDPEAFKKWLASLDPSQVSHLHEFRKEVAEDGAKAFFRRPATKALLEGLGVEVTSDGQVNLGEILSKSQLLMESKEGTEVLRYTQDAALNLLPMLKAKANGLGLNESSLAYLKKLEATEKGRSLLNWGRGSLAKARQDPEALKKWLASLDASQAGEWKEWSSDLACNSSARQELIKKVTDQCLDFLLEQVPLLDVPRIEVDSEGTEFGIDTFRISHCSVEKDSVLVDLMQPANSQNTIMQDAAEESDGFSTGRSEASAKSAADDLSVSTPTCGADLPATEDPPTEAPSTAASCADEPVAEVSVEDGCDGSADEAKEADSGENEGIASPPDSSKLNEILRVTARDITVEIADLNWTFNQKHFPHLHGIGSALAHAKGGCITIGFQLQRTTVDGEVTPCFGLSSCSVSIEELVIEIRESMFSWLYNSLVRLFQETVKQYVVSSLQRALTRNISSMLRPLNKYVRPYTPLLLGLVGLSVDALPEAQDEQRTEEGAQDGGEEEVEEDMAGLLVTVRRATGLEEHGKYWCSLGAAAGDRGGSRDRPAAAPSLVTRTRSRTKDPEWDETHLLAPWQPGEPLELKVYLRRRLQTRTAGVVSVPSDLFDARACEGALPLEGLPDCLLYFRIAPVRVRETEVDLSRGAPAESPRGPESGRLGLTVDTATLAITGIQEDGLLAACAAEQLLEAKRPRRGDYLAQVNGAPGTAAELLSALSSGRVDALVMRRARPLEEETPHKEDQEDEEEAQPAEGGRSGELPRQTSAASSDI